MVISGFVFMAVVIKVFGGLLLADRRPGLGEPSGVVNAPVRGAGHESPVLEQRLLGAGCLVLLAAVQEVSGPPGQQPGSVGFDGHVGQHFLDELVTGDLLSELLAFFRVPKADLKAASGQPDTSPQ